MFQVLQVLPDVMVMVTSHLANGSLLDLIKGVSLHTCSCQFTGHAGRSCHPGTRDWLARAQIMADVADGLCFLHSQEQVCRPQ